MNTQRKLPYLIYTGGGIFEEKTVNRKRNVATNRKIHCKLLDLFSIVIRFL